MAVKLVADSLFLIGSEAVDAFAILTSGFSEKTTVTGYGTDEAAGTTRTLALKADLKSVTGEVLPHGKVKLLPSTLPPDNPVQP